MSVAHSWPSNEETILRWFDELYRDIETGWVSLFSVERQGQRQGDNNVDWAPVDDLALLAATAADRAGNCCVWFGVATRDNNFGGRRGRANECVILPALWIDVDVVGPNHADNANLPVSNEEAWRLVQAFPLPPTAVVATGGGLQAWWFLAEPIHRDDGAATLLDRWGITWQRYAHERGIHIDSVFNLDRVMRLPGTWNRKHAPVEVDIPEADWQRRYGLDDLDPWIDELPVPTEQPEPVRRIGMDRPGDIYNARHTGADVLTMLGFVLAKQWGNSDQQWTRPGKDVREGTSATVFAEDGHVTIWSDTCKTMWPALDVRRPYDPFGLLGVTKYGGDFQRASRDLASQGYGEPRVDAGTQTDTADGDDDEPRSHGWEPADLATYLEDGYEPPQPTIGRRSDGISLFYPGRVNGVHGESGHGKSWVALVAVAQELDAGHDVLYVDLEDHANTLTRRLIDLSVKRDAIVDHLHYVQPEMGYGIAASETIENLIVAHGVTLAVIDSVGEAMTLQAMKQNDDDEVARWFRLLPRRLAALGAAVVLVDHVPKSKDAPRDYAIGSQRKRAAIDGHSMRSEQVKALGRDRAGIVKLTTSKDRNGNHPTGFAVAELHLDATVQPIAWQLRPSTAAPTTVDGDFRPTVYMERVSRALEANPGLSQNQLEKVVTGKANFVRAALRCLIDEHFIEAIPKGQGFAHTVVLPYRDDSQSVEKLVEEKLDAGF